MADEVVTLGSVIAKARKAKGLTQKELAGLVGYGPSGVSVAKIEAGAITVPSELKLEALAEALELDVQELRALAERQPKRGAFNLPALHKRNEKKRAELLDRIRAFETEVDARYKPLADLRLEVETNFLQPVFELAQRVSDIPSDRNAGVEVHDNGDQTVRLGWADQLVDDYMTGVRDSLFTQFTAGGAAGAAAGAAAGGAAGALGGAGAAFATYSAVGAFATASTGTAISALSGAAAANATMAALGGGSLAAGGFGVAGGAVVLGAIVALPALVVAGAGLWWRADKLVDRETEAAVTLSQAEDQFEAAERRIRESFGWVTKTQTFLSLALQRADVRFRDLEGGRRFGEGTCTAWGDLADKGQKTLMELFGLAAITMSVAPLPVIPTPDQDQSDDDIAKLERESREWNDAVIGKALSWFAL